MNRTVLTSFTILCLLSMAFLTGVKMSAKASPNIIHVPTDYPSIQQAINHANPGDTIFIHNGAYYENVVVNKTVSLLGESKDSTIIDGNGTGTVIVVSSDGSGVSNLTIRNSGESQSYGIAGASYGILLTNVSKCNLTDNIITNNSLGVFLESSSYNTLRNNDITMNRYNFGVLGSELSHYIQDVDNSNLVDSKPICYWVNRNGEEPPAGAGFVAIVNSTNIIVKNLDLENNYEGMLFAYTWNSTVTNSTVVSSLHGIVMFSSSNDTILDNNVTGEPYYGLGIGLIFSSNNTVLENTVTNSMYGISLSLSSNNTVQGNRIANNSQDGINMISASNNLVLNNTAENNGDGIDFHYDCVHDMVMNNTLTYNNCGIDLYIDPSNNTFSGNIIANNNEFGVSLLKSSNNTFSENQIINNKYSGVALYDSSDHNKFYHNNFINNAHSAMPSGLANIWDDGYPSGGNYWSDYNGTDSNKDGISDTAYAIDANNVDHYPLMGTFSSFNTSLGYDVNVISNSTIEDFGYFESNSTIKLHVSNMTSNQTFGFCRFCIPHTLMNVTNISVIIDDGLTSVLYPNYTLYDNGTHRWIYFAYSHSVHEIDVVTELPSLLILPPFMAATLLAVIVYRRRILK